MGYSFRFLGNDHQIFFDLELNQSWDIANNVWDNMFQNISTYDLNNNKSTEISQSWYGTSWDNVSKNEYTYDTNNNLTYELHLSWDGTSWSNDRKYTHTYN